MRVLIIGGGGREHALAWKVAQSTQVTDVFVAPGNAGTATMPKTHNIAIDVLDTDGLITFANSKHIDLTIIGPEAPLANGVVDAFKQAELACFGPTQVAAQLEASKAFSKAFMQRYCIPTAAYATFNDVADAKSYLDKQTYPIVIKADGLAAGKGVVIATDQQQAIDACETLLASSGKQNVNKQIVIEDYLSGEEASFMVMVDGTDFIPLATSQDHKARDEGDKGPNTGGMGAYSPAPVVNATVEQHIIDDIIKPTLAGLKANGIEYQGFLYAGLMIDAKGQAKVLEYNCRLGDPETQPLMMRLRSDLVSLCQACLQHQITKQTCEWDPRSALGVVLAAGGYPASYQKGDLITGLETTADTSNVYVFHAGTQQQGDNIVTAGGRVLCICALGDTIAAAQAIAYQRVEAIHWQQQYYRRDIGYRALS